MLSPRCRFLALAWVVLGAACRGGADDPEPEPPHDDPVAEERLTLTPEAYAAAGIAVGPVVRRSLSPSIRVTGTLSYDERKMAIATARVGGRISRVVADLGQRVAADTALAWIDSPELGAAQAEYRRALSMSRLREAEHERARLLLEGRAISRGELLRREADRRAAEAELEMVEQKLHILGLSQSDVAALADGSPAEHVYPVRAPLAGLVTERSAVPGRVVAPEDELFTIARLDSLWLFLQIFEKDLPSVTEGAVVQLTCESHPDERFRGTIDFVGRVLDPHSRTSRARAVIENPQGELKPGMFVYATIETPGASRPPVLAVPAPAVTDLEGRPVVFVQTDEHSFDVRPVVLGESGGEWVEVRGGLAEDERIAVSGVFTLKSELLAGGLAGHAH